MRNIYGDPAYARIQTNLVQEVFRQRMELKEPAQDDPRAFGGNRQSPTPLKTGADNTAKP